MKLERTEGGAATTFLAISGHLLVGIRGLITRAAHKTYFIWNSFSRAYSKAFHSSGIASILNFHRRKIAGFITRLCATPRSCFERRHRSDLLIIFVSACAGPEGYPDRYADALCGSIDTCVDDESTHLWTGWEDTADCRSATTREVSATPGYVGWESGDCVYSPEDAQRCLDDIHQVRSLSVCDGGMEIYEFWREALTEPCRYVYEC